MDVVRGPFPDVHPLEIDTVCSLLSENDITDVLEESFSVTEDRFGQHVIVDLKPGGSNLPVTEANKEEYVELVVAHRIAGRISEQFRAFMDGLGDALPLDLLRVF